MDLRPVYDLVVGGCTLRERFEAVCGETVRCAITRPRLQPLLAEAGLCDGRHCAGDADCGGVAKSIAPLCVNAAWVADAEVWPRIAQLEPGQGLMAPLGKGAAATDAPGTTALLAYRAASWREAPEIADGAQSPPQLTRLAGGQRLRVLRHAWEPVAWSEALLGEDLARITGRLAADRAALYRCLVAQRKRGVFVEGDGVWTHAEAQLRGPVVLDARGGPILIDAGAQVAPFTTIEGPVRIATGARVLGGRIARSFIGPGCRVRGEIESSVLLGWSNKAHEGFLGHSYVGCWANLGAGTTTSDLKNNYGEVRQWEAGAFRPTGLRKLGAVIGDHVKTAIGTLLPSGGVIGVGASVFGASGMAPRWVPAFAWGVGEGAEATQWDAFVRTTRTLLARREQLLSEAALALLESTYETTQAEGRRA